MSGPLRFYGADEAVEIDDIVIPANCAVEVTFRAFQECFFLRPDPETTEIILGCLGRAYARHPTVRIAVVSVLSNHGCLLAMPDCPETLSSFMRDFLSTAAKRINAHLGREGTFWSRRYRAIPIIDEAKLDERFAYVLTQGTKENLVWSCRDWPGVSSCSALSGTGRLVGKWRDHATEYEKNRQRERKLARARKRGIEPTLPEVEPIYVEYDIPLVPLPHWHHLSAHERHERVMKIVHDDDRATRQRHERLGTRPLGPKALLEISPFDRPANPEKSPAPRVHASTRAARLAFYQLSKTVADALGDSKVALARRWADLDVPSGMTLPPLCDSAMLRISPCAGPSRIGK